MSEHISDHTDFSRREAAAKRRSCYYCQHRSVCGTRFALWNILMDARHLNVNSIPFNAFFKELAKCCAQFKLDKGASDA